VYYTVDGESVAIGDDTGHMYILGVVETASDVNQLCVDVVADWQVRIRHSMKVTCTSIATLSYYKICLSLSASLILRIATFTVCFAIVIRVCESYFRNYRDLVFATKLLVDFSSHFFSFSLIYWLHVAQYVTVGTVLITIIVVVRVLCSTFEHYDVF